ncbi:MAG TPA: pitrilysin family protein [Polyangiaceae bacterium]|nr:pitrilysin family protein [Polyangiaceae bacterium]
MAFRRPSCLPWLALALSCTTATLALGAEPEKPAAARTHLDIPFEKLKLKNGLTVILHQDRSLPLVAVNLWYHVGPANEPRGRSGFAHLFEHLMFEGSRHVGREFDRLLESVGATNVNGTTSWDRTNYFETVPREQLEMVLWIESDRMGYMLDGLDQQRLDVQRDVVKNERRQTYENAPYGASSLTLLDTLFPAGTPYHGAIIGSMADLSAATLADVNDFFRTYYAPSNATLTVAGDFELEQVKTWVKKYFETLPDRARPDAKHAPIGPPARPERRVVKEPVELARVAFGYLTPPAYAADDPVLEVTMAILAGGKATRLYRALVMEGKLASEVDAALDSNQLASSAVVSAMVSSGKKPEEVEQAMDAVLEGLGKHGPTREELERAKRQILLNVLGNLELLNGPGGESGRAGILQRFEHYLGNPGYLPQWVAAVERVTAEDVERAVTTHLSPAHRVVVVTEPEKAAAGGTP